MAVKEFKPDCDMTRLCFFCGCTNHSDSLKQVRFFRIDGIMGDACCWDLLKKILIEIGVAEDKTLMRDIVKALKKAKRLIIVGLLHEYMVKNGLLKPTISIGKKGGT